MNWITTNIRIPEDIYLNLRIKAAKERKSVAAVIRDRLAYNPPVVHPQKHQLLHKMQELSGKIAKENKGINFTKGLIAQRYEQ